MKKVLWLASWYPNRIEPLSGDFIERHAKAVSLLNSVYVIHVLRDQVNINKQTKKIYREKRVYNNDSEASIIYYTVPFQKLPWLSKIISAFLYVKHFIREVKMYISLHGKPDLVHVHVSQRAGIVALYFKWFYNLPYVITEHWSGFCPGVRPNFNEQSLPNKILWKMIMKQALGCTTVSDYLGIALQSKIKKLTYSVIPNVVDTTIFNHNRSGEDDTFRFIHISTLGYIKNPEQIFEAIRILSSTTKQKFEMLVYGPNKPELVSLALDLNIQDYIIFKNETSQPLLAEDMRRSDALVSYSLSETFGCVIIESNACGIPVIVSDIPAFRENVIDNVTGVFVPLDMPAQLAATCLWMMENRSVFHSDDIIDITKRKYGFTVVAEQFDNFYETVLNKSLHTRPHITSVS